jgi:hypothetical protein
MADRIFICVDDRLEGAELARCLERHGLSAGLVRGDGRWKVEVRSLGEDPRSFFTDLGVALASSSLVRRDSRGQTARRRAA